MIAIINQRKCTICPAVCPQEEQAKNIACGFMAAGYSRIVPMREQRIVADETGARRFGYAVPALPGGARRRIGWRSSSTASSARPRRGGSRSTRIGSRGTLPQVGSKKQPHVETKRPIKHWQAPRPSASTASSAAIST